MSSERVIEATGSKTIKYSIVIPVYNVENYLDSCLESIYMQDRDDYEVILIDDGSIDTSGMICDVWQAKYPSITTVIHQTNSGPLIGRRKGYDSSHGKYLLTVDSDDMLLPWALDAIDWAVTQYEPDVLRFGFTRDYNDFSKYSDISFCDAATESCTTMDKTNALRLLCSGSSHNSMWSKVVNRCCYDGSANYDYFDGMTFAEDFLQTLPIYDKAQVFCQIDAILYYYRPNPNSATESEYKTKYYFEHITSLDVAQSYAQKWEQEYDVDGLVVGLNRQALWEASKYAIFLAQQDDRKEFEELRHSDAFRLRFEDSDALYGLRIDQRIELRMVLHGWWNMLKVEATIKRVLAKLCK